MDADGAASCKSGTVMPSRRYMNRWADRDKQTRANIGSKDSTQSGRLKENGQVIRMVEGQRW